MRRKLVWARQTGVTALTPAPDTEWIDLLASFRTIMGITANLPGTTVMRLRMDFFGANIAAGGVPVLIGVKQLSMRDVIEAQTDAIYSALIGPGGEPAADWMIWRALYPNHGADPTTGVPNALTYEVDVKSMRKLDEAQETLGLAIYKPTSTAGYTIYSAASVLLALP